MTQSVQLTPPAEIKRDLTHSERFSIAVEKEFNATAGTIELTGFQKKLVQSYFISIDMCLKDAERKRNTTREPLSYTWENVNLTKLAVDVITYASVGLDPMQSNHISPIPFKNKATGKYDITLMMGYRGIELKARKYGLDVPNEVIVELVYSNDLFAAFKKDSENPIEGYSFKIVDQFNRGELVGAFYYYNYFDCPKKNKIRTFSKKDIDKRKPDHASADFWGGEKDKWENGQKSGKEHVEGWYDEMAYKTIYRAAYNSITIDSEKIDKNYLEIVQREKDGRDLAISQEIARNANGAGTAAPPIGFDDVQHEVISPVQVVTNKAPF